VVTDIAVTVVGPDRPGIVAEVSTALAELGLNLTDSTMTLLRGHFAMVLVCSPEIDNHRATTDGTATAGGAATIDDTATSDRAATADQATTAADEAAVTAALRPLTDAGHLIATARALEDEPPAATVGLPHTLVVHGADRLGIVAAMTAALARAGGNITDLTTRLAGSLYLLTAEVDLPTEADVDALTADLADEAARLGVTAILSPAEADML
jgi:glycine cleavage system transcriptional repressor